MPKMSLSIAVVVACASLAAAATAIGPAPATQGLLSPCSVDSRAEVVQWARQAPGISYLAACRAARD